MKRNKELVSVLIEIVLAFLSLAKACGCAIMIVFQLRHSNTIEEKLNLIKELIAKNCIEEGLEALLEVAKSTGFRGINTIYLLKGRYYRWKRQELLGISMDKHELNKISNCILAITDEIRDLKAKSRFL